MPSVINEKTVVSIGLLALIIGAVFGFGTLYQQVQGLSQGQERIENRIARIESVLLKTNNISYESTLISPLGN